MELLVYTAVAASVVFTARYIFRLLRYGDPADKCTSCTINDALKKSSSFEAAEKNKSQNFSS